MKDIKTLKFKDIKHFVSFVMREYNKLDFLNYEDAGCIVNLKHSGGISQDINISVLGKHNIRSITGAAAAGLACGMNIEELDVSAPDYDLYNNEYVIAISNLGIWCEKFKRDGKYFNVNGTIVYISGDANSKCLPYIKSDNVYSFDVEEDNEISESDGEYTVTIKTNINDNEAMNVIDETEEYINKIKMYNFLYGRFMFDHLFI